jgi:hypothetical protein
MFFSESPPTTLRTGVGACLTPSPYTADWKKGSPHLLPSPQIGECSWLFRCRIANNKFKRQGMR